MKRKDKKQDLLYFLPICIVIAVIPFIVHQSVYQTYLENYSWIQQDHAYAMDLFLYAKGVAVCILAIIMACLWIKAKAWKKDLLIESCPIIMYIILALFSTLASVDKNVSIHGAEDQMESVFVLLSYMIILTYCMYTVENGRMIEWIQKAVLVATFVMCTIGIFQMLELDIFRTDFGKWLITLGSEQSNLEFTTELGTMYATLYNPNYVGSFTALLFPCAVCYTVSTDKKKNKAIGIIASILLIACTLGAHAKNAIISIALGLILLAVIYRKRILKHVKLLGIVALITFVSLLGINFATDNSIGRTLQQLATTLMTTQAVDHELQEIHTGDEELEVVLKEDTLHIQYFINEDGTVYFIFQDADGNYVDYNIENAVLTFPKETLSCLQVEPCMIDDIYGFSVTVDGVSWYFSNQVNDGTYYFYNYAGKYVKLEKSDEAVFTNCPGLLSGRGYIWAKTIPLLKKYIFLGSGPDTFQLVFPQNDYVDQATKFAPNMLVTRAHSMYLQTAVQTGIISLLCILALYFIYFVKSIILYNRIFKSGLELTSTVHAGIGFYVGTFSYMISGISNDSLPVTAPLFWCLLGCGIATNYMLSNEYNEKQSRMNTEK